MPSVPAAQAITTIPVLPASSAEEALRRGYAGDRILLVEDEPINREVSLELLEHVGLVPDVAEDGEQAVGRVRAAHYALILMDM